MLLETGRTKRERVQDELCRVSPRKEHAQPFTGCLSKYHKFRIQTAHWAVSFFFLLGKWHLRQQVGARWLTSPSGCKHWGLPGGGMKWWMAESRRPPSVERLFGSAETRPYCLERHLQIGEDKKDKGLLQSYYKRNIVGRLEILTFPIWLRVVVQETR